MMRILAAAIAAIFFLAGLALLGYAVIYPRTFDLTTASAIQAQQVYVQATYYAVGGIGALLGAIVCMLSVVEQRLEQVAQAVQSSGARELTTKDFPKDSVFGQQ